MPGILSHRIGYASSPQLPLDRIAGLGIKYLEVSIKPDETPDDVARLLEPHGLQVSTISPGACPLDDDDALMRTIGRGIEFARRLGGFGFFVSMKAQERPRDEVVALLRQIGDMVADEGLFLAMETHPDMCENGDKAAEALGAIDHPAIGWNYDTANIYYYNENVNGVEELRKAARFVRSVHAKDTPGGFKDPNFPNLGEGIVDFPGVAAVLAEVDFAGPWTMELEGLAGKADSVDQMEHNVRTCANHLRQLGIVD